MPLRPRYSLLTLLVLTALVAGGVKLWRGPHHVVESDGANVEKEYSYTRDWRGAKIVQGSSVSRSNLSNGVEWTEVTYYRDGQQLAWRYNIVDVPENLLPSYRDGLRNEGNWTDFNPLTATEKEDFYSAIQLEKEKTVPSNKIRIEQERNIHAREKIWSN